eukprot:11204140-Lingulodinium_polyedra.AAC.1
MVSWIRSSLASRRDARAALGAGRGILEGFFLGAGLGSAGSRFAALALALGAVPRCSGVEALFAADAGAAPRPPPPAPLSPWGVLPRLRAP